MIRLRQTLILPLLLFVLISHPILGQYDTLFFEQMDSLDDNQQKALALQLTREAQLQYESRKEWQNYVKCYERIARYLQYEGKNEERRKNIEWAIRKGKALLGEEHFIVGEALKQRGDLLFETGERDSAFLYLQQSIDLFDQIGDAENLCWGLITEAVWRFYTREYDRMAPPLQRALAIAEKHPEFDRNIPNLIFQTLAIAYRQTGAYDKSLEAAQKAVAFSLSNPDFSHQDSIELADRYNNLGIMYADRKDFQQAIQNYRIALNLRTSFKAGPSILIQTFNNLGTNLQRFGKLQEAAELFEKSRSVLATHPEACSYKDSINTFIFLADNALEQGNPLECIAILQGIRPLTAKHQFQENELHFNLGKAHSALGNYAEAVTHFQKSGPLFQARGQANLVNYARNQRRLANAYLQLGQLEPALTTVQEALQLLATDFRPGTYFDNPGLDQYSVDAEVLPLLQVKGKALQLLYIEAPDELKKISSTYHLADATIDRIRQEQLSQESKLALSTYAQAVYNDAIQLAYLHYATEQHQEDLVSAFHYMEKSKALTLLEAIRESRALESTIQTYSVADSTFGSLFREEQQLKIDRVFYERKLAEARQQQDTLKQSSIETTLAGIYEQLQILQRHFETDYPAYHQVNFRMDLATIDRVQAELLGTDSDRALIEYHLGETAIYILRITANEARFFRLAYPADFESLIPQYRLAISTDQMPEATRFRQYTHTAHQLYQSLLAPVLADIPSGIRQLYLIPDGQLGFISFESLLTAPPASEGINYSLGALDYLIESWRVSYGYSGSLLLENKRYRQGKRPKRPYAGFAPVFDELANPIASERNCEDGNPLGALLHSETSVRELQGLLGGKYYLRTQASKAHFLAAAADYQILHLSTHACVDELDPQFNRIFFADDFLPTYEIYNLRLNADLVVLSACETGYGELVKGEGIMSLARSFMYAGSPSIVTSLWNANDYSTTQIMIDFHKNLKRGLPKDEALQQAKLTYLEQAPSRLAAPYLWSNFVLIGNAEAIDLQSKQPVIWWSVGLAALLLGGGLWAYRRRLGQNTNGVG